MQNGLYGIPRNNNREDLTLKRGPDIGFSLSARYGDTGLAIPVPTLRPTNENSSMALDMSPKGPNPVEFSGNGFTWLDLCDADVQDSNYNNGVPIPVHCARVAMLSTAAQFGSVNFNGATDLPVQFILGTGVGDGIKAEITSAGLFKVGRGTDSQIFGSHLLVAPTTANPSLAVRDMVNHSEGFLAASTSVFAGSSTNHAYTIRTNNVDRATFDTSGNLTGLLSLQRTGGVAIQGTNTNNDAAAGYVGEYITSAVAAGAGPALTTGTAANVTSISLTAGDWLVTAQAYVTMATSTSYTNVNYSISSTSATMDFTPGKWINFSTPAAVIGNTHITFGAMTYRLSLASTTTIYLVAQSTFTVSTAAAWGTISGRRLR